jgi:hypothetical protein
MSAIDVRKNRIRVMLGLAIIVVFTCMYLTLIRDRPMYLDAALGLVAAGLIGASTARTRALWAHQPMALESHRQRLRAAMKAAVQFSVPVVLLFLIIALRAGYAQNGWTGALERVGNWHLLVALVLYFPWALLQQYVFQFFLFGRLLYLLPAAVAVGSTAVAFSAVHYPRVPIMAATLVAGTFWALNYRRYRSLLPLAASHALLGATLHYWVLDRDLLAAWLP